MPPMNEPTAPDPLRFVNTTADSHPRETLIAEGAYARAQSRGFVPGHELDDWLAAEQELDKGVSP